MRQRWVRKGKSQWKWWLLLPPSLTGLCLSEMRLFDLGAVPPPGFGQPPGGPLVEEPNGTKAQPSKRRCSRCVFRVERVLNKHRESKRRRRKWRMLAEQRESLVVPWWEDCTAGSGLKMLSWKQSAIIFCIYKYTIVQIPFSSVCATNKPPVSPLRPHFGALERTMLAEGWSGSICAEAVNQKRVHLSDVGVGWKNGMDVILQQTGPFCGLQMVAGQDRCYAASTSLPPLQQVRFQRRAAACARMQHRPTRSAAFYGDFSSLQLFLCISL